MFHRMSTSCIHDSPAIRVIQLSASTGNRSARGKREEPRMWAASTTRAVVMAPVYDAAFQMLPSATLHGSRSYHHERSE